MASIARVHLLILDFAGVCTPSSAELLGGPLMSTIPVRPGVLEVIGQAHAQDVQTVVLSNEISLDWELSDDLFSTVDEVISCADNRIFKPDRRAFQRCLLLTGHSAGEALVVDDEPDNITVARSLGMQTVLFSAADPAKSWGEVRGLLP